MHARATHQAFPASSLQSTDYAQTQATLLAMSCPADPSCSGCQHFSNAGSRGAWCRGAALRQACPQVPGQVSLSPGSQEAGKPGQQGYSRFTEHPPHEGHLTTISQFNSDNYSMG